MPVTLSIKNVPDEVVERLRERARFNHRSLQGELLAMVTDRATEPRRLSIRELYEEVKASGFKTDSDSTAIIRELRDSR
jgi:hypothetical protein